MSGSGRYFHFRRGESWKPRLLDDDDPPREEVPMMDLEKSRKTFAYQNGVLRERIRAALTLAAKYGMIDEAHHKMWVIDQMVRILLGGERAYLEWLAEIAEPGHSWDRGIAP